MNISLNWLRDFVEWDYSVDELAEQLTLIGLNVEEISEFNLSFPQLVVGFVESREKHPDADKLSVCRVNDGDSIVNVVCGASNVEAGMNIVFAKVGAVLPGDFKIKKAKIRGVESFGMICSESELGFASHSDGIMVLSEDLEPGTLIDDLFGYQDTVLDVEVTPNRPDLLSHIGVAREVAALNGSLLNVPDVWVQPKSGVEKLDFTVEIDDFDDCPRYTAHIARSLTVKQSPRDIQNRLLAVGLRPVNNVVDITNYVMFELGQPMHAFDLNKISGGKLFTRLAKDKETIETLDGQNRELASSDMVIADSLGAVAVAGVMGGKRSEIEDSTTDMLLESAYFNPSLVRKTSRSLQLQSDSSYRFERTVDWENVDFAAKRALYLLQKYADAKIVTNFVDRQNPDREETSSVQLRVEQVNRLLGTEITTTEVVDILQRLGLKSKLLGQATDRMSKSGQLMVSIPSFRRDLFIEVDLIEEIARIYGFNNLKVEDSFRSGTGVKRRQEDIAISNASDYLSGIGFSEIITSSFVSRESLTDLGIGEDDFRYNMMKIHNPNHGGETLLRTTLLPSMLNALKKNLNSDAGLPLKLFQTNKIFLLSEKPDRKIVHDDEELLPNEKMVVQFAIAGKDRKAYHSIPHVLMEMKGVVEELMVNMGVKLNLEPGGEEPYFQSGLQYTVYNSTQEAVGTIGYLSRSALVKYGIETPVAVAELNLKGVISGNDTVAFVDFSRFPAVKRDLSLIAPESVSYQQIVDEVTKSGAPLLKDVKLFDIYKGENIPAGTVSMGIRLKFQSDKSNLKGKAVDHSITKIVDQLSDEFDVSIRD